MSTVGLRELAKYKVGEAEVTIFGDYRRNLGKYIVREPALTESGRAIYNRLLKELHSSPSIGETTSTTTTTTTTIESLKKEIGTAARTLDVAAEVEKEFHAILYKYSKEVIGYDKADALFSDPELEEITLPSAKESLFVIHRKFSEFNYMETNIRFDSAEDADRFIHRMMHRVNRAPSIANPIMDGTNEQGDRYAVILGKEVSRGSTFSIRKVSRKVRTVAQLIESKTLSHEVADYLLSILKAKGVVFIVGPTGTGKTTLLNALVNEMPHNWKIITIEETPEIQLSHRLWVAMFTRFSTQSAYAVEIMDLVKASLRHRPDMLVVGESRGEEVREMFQAAATGHGLISTFHAIDTNAMLSRMTGEPLNVKESFIQLVWAVVTVRNVINKEGAFDRRIVAIDEILRKGGSYSVENVFAYDYADDTIVSQIGEGKISTRTREAQVLARREGGIHTRVV